MFGLAQLYQIRGRVGRSKLRAYAFFMTEPRKKLHRQAEKRLRVLAALDSLGAGFTLASQDPDIRGAGNLLGEEQSGQVREVGFELYQEMLEEAIAKLRSGEIEMTDDGEWSPQINLGVPVLIPESLCAGSGRAAGLYRRLSGLERKVELEAFAAELIDRFGPLPARGRDAAARGADQGALQAGRDRAARRRAEGRDGDVPQRQVREPGGAGAVPERPEGLGAGQGQQDRGPPRLGRARRRGSRAASASPATSRRWPGPQAAAAGGRRPVLNGQAGRSGMRAMRIVCRVQPG